MTRPVEIPEAAVEAAAQQLHPTLWDGQPGNRHAESARADVRERVRLVLSAALPYLVPAEPAKCHRCGYELRPDDTYTRLDGTTYHLRSCPDRRPVPAGDGGLREALKELKLYCSKYVDGDGSEDEQVAYDDIHIQLSRILAAHPAGSEAAVADRERVVEVLDFWLQHFNIEPPFGFFSAVVDALFAAGVVRSEAEVKAEALRQATEVLTEAWQESRPEHQAGLFVAIRKLRECANELEGKR